MHALLCGFNVNETFNFSLTSVAGALVNDTIESVTSISGDIPVNAPLLEWVTSGGQGFR